MKQFIKQLAWLLGAARALEESLPMAGADFDLEEVQNAHDLTIAIEGHLRAMRAALGLAESAPAEPAEHGYLLPDWVNEELERSAS